MRVSVFGLGHVGATTAACLAREGHQVVGVDISRERIELFNSGKSPLLEEKLGEIIEDAVAKGNLSATLDTKAALADTDLSFICVGTPSGAEGDLDLTYVLRVTEKIGQLLKLKSSLHTLIYRSTLLPGTTEERLIPLLEESSGKKIYLDFDVCYNPSFMREGSCVADFYDPPFTVVGQQSEQAARVLEEVYAFLHMPFELTSIKSAELLKFACNSFHAVKANFANEIGAIAKRLGLDGHELMRLFRLDEKLNLSETYLEPGLPLGGPTLPKDVRGLLHLASKLDCPTPLLDALQASRQAQIEQGIKLVTSLGAKKIGILGLAFKNGTDDLRESPQIVLAERLLADGYELLLYDKYVNPSKILGANKEYAEAKLPILDRLFASSVEDVIHNSEVIVIGHREEDYVAAVRKVKDRQLVDFARAVHDPSQMGDNYHGIYW